MMSQLKFSNTSPNDVSNTNSNASLNNVKTEINNLTLKYVTTQNSNTSANYVAIQNQMIPCIRSFIECHKICENGEICNIFEISKISCRK